VVRWQGIDDDNVVGYSLYRGDERINEKVLTESDYLEDEDVVVKPVIRGGHETVYGSRQRPLSVAEDMDTPIAYSFTVFPNPCAQETRVDYAVPCQTSVEIVVYDASGRRVKGLLSDICKPGYFTLSWNGCDERGRAVPAGVYFIFLETNNYRKGEKTILLK